ncbi:MAG: metal-dependent transcriptional regulator, partial [Bacteroidota bacterium]
MHSITEENYLKAIFKIIERDNKAASTNAIAKEMNTSAASVTDMMQKLAAKDLVQYQKYKGANLSPQGNKIATQLIRKHRLWEVFLVEQLKFKWDQVHELAEELEHINSDDLTNRLDEYLGFPKFDPHGDPIPNADGKFTIRIQEALSKMEVGSKSTIVGVREHSQSFLKFLDELKLNLGTTLEILEIYEFENSMKVRIDGNEETVLSNAVSQNIFVK